MWMLFPAVVLFISATTHYDAVFGITLDVRSGIADSNRQLAEIPSIGIQPSCFEGIRYLYQGASTSISKGPNRLTSEPTVKDTVSRMSADVG